MYYAVVRLILCIDLAYPRLFSTWANNSMDFSLQALTEKASKILEAVWGRVAAVDGGRSLQEKWGGWKIISYLCICRKTKGKFCQYPKMLLFGFVFSIVIVADSWFLLCVLDLLQAKYFFTVWTLGWKWEKGIEMQKWVIHPIKPCFWKLIMVYWIMVKLSEWGKFCNKTCSMYRLDHFVSRWAVLYYFPAVNFMVLLGLISIWSAHLNSAWTWGPMIFDY